MSQTLSPVVIQNNGNGVPSNTFSVLSTVTPSVPRPSVQVAPTVPLAATPLSSARLTGLVAPNAQIVPVSTPVAVHQTVNSPVIPVTTVTVPTRASPRATMTQLPSGTVTTSSQSPVLSQQVSTRTIGGVPVQVSLTQPSAQVLNQQTVTVPTQAVLSQSRISSGPVQVSPVTSQVAINQSRLSPVTPQVSPVSSQVAVNQQLTPAQMGFSQQVLPGTVQVSPSQVAISQQQMTPGLIAINQQQLTPSVQLSPSQQRISPVQVNTLSGSPVQISVGQQPSAPSSPTARMALLNLNNGSVTPNQPSVTIPNLTASQGIINVQTGLQSPSSPMNIGTRVNQESLLFPSIKVATPTSSLPLKPTAELMNKEFEVRDYQGIISNASIENELLNAGYAPLSKIVIRTDNGDKRTQYIKALNKKGQKVFILLDVNGYTTARSTDLTLIEAHSANIVPYSLKTGAYECAGKDVCGVAFECGSDAVCVLARGSNDLTPKEANFVFVEQRAPAAATIESEGSIMSYPVIRLSEIRANPDLVLSNTDMVTRRLRNNAYVSELQEIAYAQKSLNNLNAAFVRFEAVRQNSGNKLNQTLTQLEQWNNVYMANPPTTDAAKDRYRRLQYNLAQRNEGIANLLRYMKKVADKRLEIDAITKEINDITDLAEKEFANVEFAVSD